ncbi:MAG TPA: tetratricopeptide repeat protein [Candidatus Sulfotelmatobacter sp.]
MEYTRIVNCREWMYAVLLMLNCFTLGAIAQQSSAERYAEEGQSALAAGRYAEAETAFAKLRELEPSVAEVHANLGLVYFQERKFAEAIPALRKALKLKPMLLKSSNLLVISLSETGRYKEAVPGLEKCFHRSGESEMKRMCGLELQHAYSGLKQDSQAVDVSLELNRLFPDDGEILYQTGKVYGNFAFVTMEKLARVAPNSVWRHLAAAEAHESQGSYDQAIQEYHEVLRIAPNRPGIHYRIGRSLLGRYWQRQSQNDLPAAQKEFEQELQSDPTNANAAYEVGELHRRAGEMDEAERYLEQALKYYPDFPEAQLGLCAVLLEKKQPQQALEHAQRAAAVDPENEVAWFRLAKVQRTLGNVAEQQKALAQYRHLHDIANQQKEVAPVFSPREVTKQEVDPNPSR